MTGGHIPDEVIDRIRLQTDLVEIVSAHVTLKRTGKNYVGLCPFHAEKTPSFSVNVERQIFHCFGCGSGGNVFTFLTKTEGISFPEAVRKLGARAGIPIPEPARREETDPEAELKKRILQANEEAAGYFRRELWESKEGSRAREYLLDRGITRETSESFGLGYAPPSWDGLLRGLASRCTPDLLEKAGLAIPRESGKGHYDRFRDRIICPIQDLQGRVVGFGGRVLDQGLPKYLNSPESPVFSKGRHLFAMNRSREGARRSGFLVVVEGYFDAIALHQAGLDQVVATLGTALTSDHIAQIRRFTPRVILMFDPDLAGMKAARRALDLFIGSGVRSDAVRLPGGEDPDTFIRKEGADAFQKHMESALPLMEFAVRGTVESLPPKTSIESRVAVLEEYFPLIARLGHRVEISHYLRRLAELLRVDEKSVISDFRARRFVSQASRPAPTAGEPSLPASAGLPAGGRNIPSEEETLVHLALHGRVDPTLLERLSPAAFSDARCRAILETLEKAGWLPRHLETLFMAVESVPGARDLAARLSLREIAYDDPRRTADDCIVSILQKRMRKGLQALDHEIRAAEAAGNSREISSLQAKKMRLKKESMKGVIG